jgi:hypothetical protein
LKHVSHEPSHFASDRHGLDIQHSVVPKVSSEHTYNFRSCLEFLLRQPNIHTELSRTNSEIRSVMKLIFVDSESPWLVKVAPNETFNN